MSLADELLADLEEAAEEEEGGSYGEEEEEPAIEDVQEETQLDLSGDSVKSIAKLWDSKMVSGTLYVNIPGRRRRGRTAILVSDRALLPHQFAEIMMKIEEYISKQAKASEGDSSPSVPLFLLLTLWLVLPEVLMSLLPQLSP